MFGKIIKAILAQFVKKNCVFLVNKCNIIFVSNVLYIEFKGRGR